MRSSYRSFASRLAALERLEEQAEQQAVIDNEVPNARTVEAMDDGEALWNAVLAMRRYSLHVDLRFSQVALSRSHYRDDRCLPRPGRGRLGGEGPGGWRFGGWVPGRAPSPRKAEVRPDEEARAGERQHLSRTCR